MPRTTYGLLKAIRSHYIENPSVAASVRTGRPNGCNLCHLDRTLAWTDQYLNEWYGTALTPLDQEQRSVSGALLWALRGDAGQRALTAWHMGWGPALRASGDKWEVPFLAQLLADPYAAVRYIAGHSLRQLPGFRDFRPDSSGTPEERALARDRALAQFSHLVTDRSGPELLLGPDGRAQAAQVNLLLEQRDNASMDLQE